MEQQREQAKALFEYIKHICLMNQKKILDADDHPGNVLLSSFADASCVTLYSRDTLANKDERAEERLFTFKKPDFTQCPSPDESLIKWLKPGWDEFNEDIVFIKRIEIQSNKKVDAVTEDEQQTTDEATSLIVKQYEYFEDDPKRVTLFNQWVQKRSAWAKREQETARLRGIFNDLFDMYSQYHQSPDALEIVIGNGFMTDRRNKAICHPLLLKRASLSLDAVRNVLTLSDTDEATQFYMPMLSAMEDIQIELVYPLETKADEQNIHPWDHHEGADLLKSATNQITSHGLYLGEGEQEIQKSERIVVRWEPCIILRKRPDGTDKTLESILDDLDQGAEIPASLRGILGDFSQRKDADAESMETLNGKDDWTAAAPKPLEDEDILLPKPANREQMDIVRKIEHEPVVLVQGPPGTGKTHTIANLLGHFLAKGQTVLVTSHTSKALTVLKEKVPKEIQALCVTVFGDNRADMEESINAIIEHISTHNSRDQGMEAGKIRNRRHETFRKLQSARELVYAIRHKEFEPIVYCGESYSPSKAAEYVAQHEELMTLIPGDVVRSSAFPLTQEELTWLYASNGLLTQQDEEEITTGLPDAARLMTPQQFAEGLELTDRLQLLLQNFDAGKQAHLAWVENRHAVVNRLTDQVYLRSENASAEASLRGMLARYEESIPGWAAFAMADGAEKALPRKRWEQLLSLIDETYEKAQVALEKQLNKPIKILSLTHNILKPRYEELQKLADKTGHVKKTLFMSKEKKDALDAVTIAGAMPETAEDIKNILEYFELLTLREKLEYLWNSLLASHGEKAFANLGDEPERYCYQHHKEIDFWLNWMERTRKDLYGLAENAGIGVSLLQPLADVTFFTDEKAKRILRYLKEQLVPAANLLQLVGKLSTFTYMKEDTTDLLQEFDGSVLCANLLRAIENDAVEDYKALVSQLISVQDRSEIQLKRGSLLDKLAKTAPGWADAIRNRQTCHGASSVPKDLLTAWKVRQLSLSVDEITSTSQADAEKQVATCVDRFRAETEELAAVQAWCGLQQRFNNNPEIQSDLNAWKQVMAKLGKGTGKRAPALRAEAKKLMTKCQKAVPAWIMPTSVVMNSIDPQNTKFDVVIIDEASQSDITSAPVLYMGRKVIVVGDDEQVSPMAVGTKNDEVQKLQSTYIKGKIPNAILWEPTTSLYDIAAQNYPPVMLREHFRCVPDIIGYSNMLSYKGKIKPLREAGSSPFKTAIIPYRVNGMRNGNKTNEEEANTVVALIKACLEHEEYANKTFGVISMLGSEQAKLVDRKLVESIPMTEYENHRILCGDASNLQGDERDVVFLSLVDSHAPDGPLSMASGEGQGPTGKSMRQRYNVAVSRAKDQLWIVHSLDYNADLKSGDMRRTLLEYAANPQASAIKNEAIDRAADSPFEAEVAKSLVAQGYHIIQQWPVGAYRIDMVALCGHKKVAIECDGERWHSGEEKIREDMERQSVLERLGWKFIRIRGSEYYRQPNRAIARVVSELNDNGILPEASAEETTSSAEDALTLQIKVRAEQLMQDHTSSPMQETADASPAEKPLREEPKQQELPRTEPLTEEATDETTVAENPPVRTEPVAVRPSESTVPMHPEEQLSMFASEDDLLTVLQGNGFTCIDNRSTSGILWVLFDQEKEALLNGLAQQYQYEAEIERRGAVATGGKKAWRIQTKKEGGTSHAERRNKH